MQVARRRILFVIKNLQQGGTERQVLGMMRSLDRERYDVALCTFSSEIHYDGLPTGEPRYPLAATGRRAVQALRDVLEEFRPHLVHSFRDVVNRWTWRALRGLSVRPAWLMSVRGRPILPLDLLWASVMHRRAFRVTVNSIGIESSLRRFTTIPRQSIEVVPNMIDDREFRPPTSEQRRTARARLDLSQDAFVWLLPGRLSWVKNQIGLVLALWLLKVKRALPAHALVLLAGRRRDRLPSAIVPGLIRVLGLRGRVRLIDAVRAPSTLYAAADALVLPSLAEGMPNVVLEAHLSELPVVVSHEANRDLLVTDGESGLVVPSLSPWGVADQLARMMGMSVGARRRLAINGRNSLLRQLASTSVAQQLSVLYERAVRSGDVDVSTLEMSDSHAVSGGE